MMRNMKSTPSDRDGVLPASLIDRVLERLGFGTPPAIDLDGLSGLYAAWCARVPFDNVRKIIALRTGAADRNDESALLAFLDP